MQVVSFVLVFCSRNHHKDVGIKRIEEMQFVLLLHNSSPRWNGRARSRQHCAQAAIISEERARNGHIAYERESDKSSTGQGCAAFPVFRDQNVKVLASYYFYAV